MASASSFNHLAPPSNDEEHPWTPRSSTPLGPHPMSPSKKPPTPIQPISEEPNNHTLPLESPETSDGSVLILDTFAVNHHNNSTNIAPSSADQETSAPPNNDQSVQSSSPPSPPSPPTSPSPRSPTSTSPSPPTSPNQPYDFNDTVPSNQPQQQQQQSLAADNVPDTPAEPVPIPLPDWMTDELDESWHEPSVKNVTSPPPSSNTNNDKHDTTPITSDLQNQVVHYDDTNPHHSASTLSPSHPPPASLVSSQVARSSNSGQSRPALGLGRPTPMPVSSVSDSELQVGPCTPSKRFASHLDRHQSLELSAENEKPEQNQQQDSFQSSLSAPEDFESARASFVEVETTQEESLSPGSSSTASAAKGTFIHKANVSSIPAVLKPLWQSPNKAGQNKKRLAMMGGDIFTPLKLQTMFKTPTPPDRPFVAVQPDSHSPDPLQQTPAPISHTATPLGFASQSPPPSSSETQIETSSSSSSTLQHPSHPKPKTPTDNVLLQLPSVPFTFRSPPVPTENLRSKSQRRSPDLPSDQLHPTILNPPASAAAKLSLPSPAFSAAGSGKVSGPSTPHTPMRLFKFNYQDAATRARLEMLVSPALEPGATKGETERERKRLRLEWRPRKVTGGDLSSARAATSSTRATVQGPVFSDDDLNKRTAIGLGLGFPAMDQDSHQDDQQAYSPSLKQPHSYGQTQSTAILHLESSKPPSTKTALSQANSPVVDYVKEASGFIEALQKMDRIGSDQSAESKDWFTEDEIDPPALSNAPSNLHALERSDPTPHTFSKHSTQKRGSFSSSRPSQAEADLENQDRAASQASLRLSDRRLSRQSFGNQALKKVAHRSPHSTTKSSKNLVSRVQHGNDDESPRKLLRTYSATVLAEEEALREMQEETSIGLSYLHSNSLNRSTRVFIESLQRDEQIKELESRIAKRALARGQSLEPSTDLENSSFIEAYESDERMAEARRGPHLITLHEPTLEDIQQSHGRRSLMESDLDRSAEDVLPNSNSDIERCHDGIVLYDSEKIVPPNSSRHILLRHATSAAELRSQRGRNGWREDHAVEQTRAVSDGQPHPNVSHQTQQDPAPSSKHHDLFHRRDVLPRRGDRTTSSNTLVDDVGHTFTGTNLTSSLISNMDSRGATITRRGSMLNISQIPEQELESLGGGKLTYNKTLNKWEKIPNKLLTDHLARSQASSSSQGEESEMVPGTRHTSIGKRSTTTRTPAELTILEASSETLQTDNISVLHNPAKFSNPIQLITDADGKGSDSSDPFKDFESIGQTTMGGEASTDDVSMPNLTGHSRAALKRDVPSLTPSLAEKDPGKASSSVETGKKDLVDLETFTPSLTCLDSPERLRGQPSVDAVPLSLRKTIATAPKSSSSLRNVVNFSPDSTAKSSVSALRQSTAEEGGGVSETKPSSLSGSERQQSPNRVKPLTPSSHLVSPQPMGGTMDQSNLATPSPRFRHVSPPKSILKHSTPLVPAKASMFTNGNLERYPVRGNPSARSISFATQPTVRSRQLAEPTRSQTGRLPPASDRYDTSQSLLDDTSSEDHESFTYRVNNVVPNETNDRTHAISLALKHLAELTLGSEVPAASPSCPIRPSATPSRRQGQNTTAGRSPWSFHTLRNPRKIAPKVPSNQRYAQDFVPSDQEYDEIHGYPDMTLLTEASFNFAHDKILQVITDVEPWEPGWDALKMINLSGRRLESCVRLKEFLPSLEELRLDKNEISYLTGLPSTLKALLVRDNHLTHLASFGHLLNLEVLDVSGNQIESLSHFECLTHLHTLKADNNQISSLDGIDRLKGLVHVSLSMNHLSGVHLERTDWGNLKSLNLSHNRLATVRGLPSLANLRTIDLDYNRLSQVDLAPLMPRLKVLRVSGNPELQNLDVHPARKLRTLYADYCSLTAIDNIEVLVRLENLSMRQQTKASIVWPAHQFRDIRRLFFSGNAFPHGLTFEEISNAATNLSRQQPIFPPCFLNLAYLELAACQLTCIPAKLAELAPNLRSLNLDHNLLSTLPSLAGMQRLKRLSLVGCRIRKSKSIINAVYGLEELQVLDARTNPCTLGLYPPVVIPVSSIYDLRMASPHSGVEELIEAEAMACQLPPVPNPAVVQPDKAEREQRQLQPNVGETSHFHRRHAPSVDYAEEMPSNKGDDGADNLFHRTCWNNLTSLFHAADQRFILTLPRSFRERRTLHRGVLAMSCKRLNWIDGLFIEEHEILEADKLVHPEKFNTKTNVTNP